MTRSFETRSFDLFGRHFTGTTWGDGVPAAEGDLGGAVGGGGWVLHLDGARLAGKQRDVVVGVVGGQDALLVAGVEQGEFILQADDRGGIGELDGQLHRVCRRWLKWRMP